VTPADGVAPANPVASAEGEGYRDGEEIIDCEVVVLAVGHSARDTFRMLKEKRIAMTQKPFSIGVRIEHSQDLIDIAQYGKPARELGLPVAEYKVNYRCMADGPAEGRGVYTFCMCPGGHVISAASQPGGIVTNGMSYHDRDSSMANSALLCDVRTSDFGSDDVLAGVVFQEKYEQLAFAARRKLAESGAALQVDGTASEGGALPVDGGALLTEGGAAQTLGKPVETQSTDGTNPYAPPKSTWGMLRDGHAPEVESCLPAFAMAAFREAMPYLGKKLKGFDDEKAVVSAVETRSSSPIRMTRDDGYEGRIEMGMESASESSGGADAKTGLELDAATDAKTGAEPDVTADAKTGAEPGVAADTKTGAEPGVAADTKTGRLHGFYPCGEGAGYAGGITSAAVDGIRVAEAIIGSWLM
jgi:hypothetical protein